MTDSVNPKRQGDPPSPDQPDGPSLIKERLTALQKLYEAECADNYEIHRRCSYLIGAITLLATLCYSALRVSGVVGSWPSIPAVLAVLAAVGGTAALACSAVCAAQGMSPTRWDYPDTEKIAGSDESAMICEWHRVIDENRDRNEARFHRHYCGFQCLLAAMVLIGFQGAVCAAHTMSTISNGLAIEASEQSRSR